MNRLALVFLASLAAPSFACAEILPSFSMGHYDRDASHVVVVDNFGKVQESWRGDLKPGDLLPLKELHIPLEADVGQFGKKEGAPQKVSGERLVLFLKRGMSVYDRAHTVGSWATAASPG